MSSLLKPCDDISPNGAKWDWGICPKPFWHVENRLLCMNPIVIIFITWLMIIKVVFWAKKTAQNLHTLTINRHAIFHYGVHATFTQLGVNFRFIAFAFQPRRVKYDLGIMRADRVRYGQVVISFMKKIKQGQYIKLWVLDFLRFGVFFL